MYWFSIGTGCGAGIMHNRVIYRGAHGEHPELGHISIAPRLAVAIERAKADPNFQRVLLEKGAICGCGHWNCLEAVVSGSGIERLYGCQPVLIDNPEVWEEIGTNLGQGLRNAIHAHGTKLIVLGSSVAVEQGEKLLAPARRYLENCHKGRNMLLNMPEIRLTALNDQANLLGALAFAFEKSIER